MSSGKIIEAAWHSLGGCIGEIAAALELRRPVPKARVLRWVKQLRSAADLLEKLLE